MDWNWLKYFNNNYASAISAFTPFVIGIASWVYYGIYKESQVKKIGQVYIPSSFWSLRERHRVDTLKRFELSEDKKSYIEIETLYTPESWNEYIDINRCFFKTTIIPKNRSDILALSIKRNPHENWKIIYFNR